MNEHDIRGMPIRLLFVRYLMASFLYYKANRPSPWSDNQFDLACKRLLTEWESFDHPHKHLTDPQSLKAGTGYQIKYPTITQNCAYEWLDKAGPWYGT